MKFNLILFFLVILWSCKSPEVRKPVSGSNTVDFMEASIARHKKLNKLETNLFQKIIKNDTIHHYKKSNKGFWYSIDKQIDTTSAYPKYGDEVVINYEIRSIRNDVIYKQEELGTRGEKDPKDRLYKVDGEDFIQGLQEGIKLMKLGETATFLFPSDKVFGATGFQNRINPNQPLIIEVFLKEIKYKQNNN
ncbi:MAG: gliding motility-associated peptidyl-prolyl isomerase GldI [Flavobacteriaceae bacterium]